MIHPMPGFAVVQPLKSETKTKSGVYTGKEDMIAPTEGEILAITFKEDAPTALKDFLRIGRMVIYRAFAGQVDAKEGVLILPIAEIWGARD